MSDMDGSNALVTVVRFYSDALARADAGRRQAEETLRRVLSQSREPYADPEREALLDAVMKLHASDSFHSLTADEWKTFADVVQAYRRTRNEVDRVEPGPAREGSVRGARPDGDADVPRPDR